MDNGILSRNVLGQISARTLGVHAVDHKFARKYIQNLAIVRNAFAGFVRETIKDFLRDFVFVLESKRSFGVGCFQRASAHSYIRSLYFAFLQRAARFERIKAPACGIGNVFHV